MKTFIFALICLTLFTTVTAESTGNFLGLKPECFSHLTEAWNIVIEVYEAFSSGKSSDLFNIVMKLVPLWNSIQTDCLN